MTGSTPPPRVLVAVLTFRRVEELSRLLPVLVGQAESATAARARVLVVDNDPAGSAEPVVGAHVGDVRYVHEPRPGIAAGRNRALAEGAGCDAVVFVDDDEVPAPGWLDALVDAWTRWGCAGVAGPVVSTWEGTLDPWLEASGTFARPRRTTGSVLPGAATNNLLLDLRILRRTGTTFDDAFGLTGGSDTMLTRELVARGEQLRWCDEAEVLEAVPADRLTREFVLRRHLRTGTTWSRVHLALRRRGLPGGRTRTGLALRGAALIGRGAALLVRPRVADRSRGACRLASGAGVLLGAIGLRYTEYARPRTPGGQRRTSPTRWTSTSP
ncbi:glycosyltransferase [Kineococcus sp. NPDC059986]|uniref:glycosyltransferase n=1 Tax=Kineococcus sp. NPDC059986 TaxID=3155538 RepID=UPI00344DC0B3